MRKVHRLPDPCPGCSCTTGRPENSAPAGVYCCARCNGLIGRCYLGDTYVLVSPWFAEPDRLREMQRAHDGGRYFDLIGLGSAGIERRHGWYDPLTRRVIQAG